METNDPVGILKVCVARKVPVDVFLVSGVRLRGRIHKFTQDWMTLDGTDGKMLVRLGSVASVVVREQ